MLEISPTVIWSQLYTHWAWQGCCWWVVLLRRWSLETHVLVEFDCNTNARFSLLIFSNMQNLNKLLKKSHKKCQFIHHSVVGRSYYKHFPWNSYKSYILQKYYIQVWYVRSGVDPMFAPILIYLIIFPCNLCTWQF